MNQAIKSAMQIDEAALVDLYQYRMRPNSRISTLPPAKWSDNIDVDLLVDSPGPEST